MPTRGSSSRPAWRDFVTLAILPLALMACAPDNTATTGATGSVAERAFLSAMIEHHVAATEMARLARRRADAPLLGTLANSIIETHAREILQMDAIHRRLFGTEVVPDEGAPALLGLSAENAALDDADSFRALERARLFDLAFVDTMVVHHLGALALVGAVLQLGGDAELRLLAESIAEERREQVLLMSDFREAEYGEPVSVAGAGAGGPSTDARSLGPEE